jgi:hypothetical protein
MAPRFWSLRIQNTPLRFYLWLIPIVLFWIERLPEQGTEDRSKTPYDHAPDRISLYQAFPSEEPILASGLLTRFLLGKTLIEIHDPQNSRLSFIPTVWRQQQSLFVNQSFNFLLSTYPNRWNLNFAFEMLIQTFD